MPTIDLPTTGVRCACCGLVWPRPGCAVCPYHRSAEINQTVKRHREHEEMLRARLDKATEWAAEKSAEAKEAKQKMHWAYKSRDRAIQVLAKVGNGHQLRIDGACSCGRPKNCREADLVNQPGVQQLIHRVDEYEAQRREGERVYREIMAQGDPDHREDMVRRTEPRALASGASRPDARCQTRTTASRWPRRDAGSTAS